MGLDKKSEIVRNVVSSVIIIVNRTKYFVNFKDAMLLFISISPLSFYNKNITLNLSNNNKNYRFSINDIYILCFNLFLWYNIFERYILCVMENVL